MRARHAEGTADRGESRRTGTDLVVLLIASVRSQQIVLSVAPKVSWMAAATDMVPPTNVHKKYADRQDDRFVEALNETKLGNVT
jgi:hypothetical protein